MIAGGILQAGSSYSQGQNTSRMATLTAQQLNNNATLAGISANNAMGSSQAQAKESLRQNQLLQSKQIAIAAAGGGDASEKSVQDVISNTAAQGRLAADTNLYEGNLRSIDYLNQAIGLKNQAATTLYNGRQARTAGNIGVVSSIIGSGASAGTFYGKYGNKAPSDKSSYGNYNLDI